MSDEHSQDDADGKCPEHGRKTEDPAVRALAPPRGFERPQDARLHPFRRSWARTGHRGQGRLVLPESGAAALACDEVLTQPILLRDTERAIHVIREELPGLVASHGSPLRTPSFKAALSMSRPRFNRVRTVASGKASSAATSAVLRSSKWRRTSTSLKVMGKD